MSESSADHLRIALVCDPQLGFTRRMELEGGTNRALPVADIDHKYFKQAMDRIKLLDPPVEAVLITGDMVDDADDQAQWAEYNRITAVLETPVYEAMGNHDGFSMPGLDFYRNVLKKNDYYGFTIRGVYFLVLNSNYLKNPGVFPQEPDTHRRFVEKELEDHRDYRYKILVMHHPLYFEHPDEEEGYFSLPPEGRKWVLDLVDEFDVRAVMSGHYHRNHIVKYHQCDLITSGPTSMVLGFDDDGNRTERGFRVLDFDLDSGLLFHEYVQLNLSV